MAEFLVDFIMSKFDNFNTMAVKKTLQSRIRRKGRLNPNNLVDAGFVLRILLEQYRID